ncbi:acyl-CoA dehydrogenase family protein [Streptomyces sp. NPDC059874]|uniref:acyl-CoA dehydrogenase family protein n=1 Tax=Streptomyces sp. NPDC059874 TaxID=3346983 RepID=UPI00364CAFD4
MSGLEWTPEQEELRDAVRAVLARHPGHAAWAPLTAQVGAAALAVPEEYGGLGCGAAEVGVVMAELGRALSPVPYLGSAVLTVQALLASGDEEACAKHLPALAQGSLVGALAWAESPRGGPDAGAWPNPGAGQGAGAWPNAGKSPGPTPGRGPDPTPGGSQSPTPGGSHGPTPGGSQSPTPSEAQGPTPGGGQGPGPGPGTAPRPAAALGPGLRAGRGGWEAADIATRAEPDGAGWLLTGTKQYVLAGPAEPSLILVLATIGGAPGPGSQPGQGNGTGTTPGQGNGRLGLFELTAPPAAFTSRSTMDRTRPLAELTLARTPARLLSPDGAGVLARVRDLACTALAAEQAGAAARALEATVRYAKDRIQFGRPIGSFQAVKHRLADMYTAVESARSIALAAAAAEAPPHLAAAAKSACSQAYSYVAGEMIQLHGGIGITWEHEAHEFFKRAHGSALLFGSPAEHRARIATELGYGPGRADVPSGP